MTEEAFEKGYRRYVEKLAGPPPPRSEPARAAYESLRRSVEAAIEGRRHAEAESLLAIAETRFPNAADWSAASIVVYRASGDRDRLATALARRVERDWDDLESRLELAHLAADRADFAALERWTFEALRIDAVSADAHALHGRALSERGRAAEAIEDFDVAVALQPERSEHRLGLARALLAAGRKDRARAALDALLAREPEQPEARELLKTLEQP